MQNQIPLLDYKLLYGLFGLLIGGGGILAYFKFFYIDKKKVPAEIELLESQIHKTDSDAEVSTINAVNNFLDTLIKERQEVYKRIANLEDNNSKKLELIIGLREDLRRVNDRLELEEVARRKCQDRLDKLEDGRARI